MRARREPSVPPLIPGFEYVRLLGLGGFADVFEYRQDLPARSVAVKVLLASSIDEATRERFFVEANLMAQLSHHPSIVTIHHADIAADGRPFLVMEYCSRPGLGSRYRAERISVTEALRTGVRLASAIEAAHRLGILHRDIKPANILTTDYGYPALTDFGIAATMGGDSAAGTGMSIPWSPPELLAEDPQGDVRGDVYSLGATIYSMLAGRSPFEVPGQPNGPADLINRIERSPLPNIDRDDVPPGLQALLARTMSKDPVRRYPTALAVAQALQQVERSLGLTVTQIDVPDDLEQTVARRPAPGMAEGEATRLRPIVSIDPAQPPTVSSAASAAPPTPAPSLDTAARAAAAVTDASGGAPVPVLPAFLTPPPQPTTAPRGPRRSWTARSAASASGSGEPTGGAAPRRVGRIVAGAAASVVVVGVLAVAAVYTFGEPEPPAAPTTSAPSPSPQTVGSAAVPTPVDLTGVDRGDGTILFGWVNPAPEEGDRYLWGVDDERDDRSATVATSVVVPLPEGEGTVCIEVSVVRKNGKMSTHPARACYP